jgi:hypothetical protein
VADVALTWQWPFSRSELTAGLRRHLASNSVRLLDVQPIDLPETTIVASLGDSGTTLTGLSVSVRIDGEEQNLPLLLKEPPVSRNGRVLRAVGQREFGVYRRLAPHLPLLVPSLIAGQESTGWLVIEVLSSLRPANAWTVEDYTEALHNLVAMHDRFWDLAPVLVNYPWLARPLQADFSETVAAARDTARGLKRDAHLLWLKMPQYRELLDQLTDSADAIIAPLRDEVETFIHGDYWPGNIAQPIDGRQIVFDWQLAGIGPAILDLVWFAQAISLQLEPPLPVSEMIACYRQRADSLFKPDWDDDHFARLWDHALMWLFMAHWFGKLATMTPETYQQINDRFQATWLEPVQRAAATRL